MCPKKQKTRTSLLALAFVLLVVPAQPVFAAANNPFPATQSVSSEIEFALTGTETGWLRSGDLLFRTESNGTDWQDVTPTLTPSEALVDAYFIDSSHAFALTVSANSEEWQLNLLETVDFGFSWQVQPVTLPKPGGDFLKVPFGNAFLQWQNDENGWILIKQATSSNFSLGILLKTNDNGQTWKVSEPPAAEEFVFLDEKLGFMRDPVDPTRLYQTLDGGLSWQGFRPLIAQTAGDGLERVDLPTKWQDGKLLIPAWVKGGEFESELIFFTAQHDLPSTADEAAPMEAEGGINPQSWQESFGSALAFTQLSSFDGENFWLGLTNGSCKQDTLADEADLPLSTLTCENKYLLLSSQDGGEHWAAGNFPSDGLAAIESNIQIGTFQNITEKDQLNDTIQSVQRFVGHGFDTCEIPSLSKLQTWYNGSPYKAVNLYIGGVSRACDNSALNAAYVQQMFNQGWRFIPTWVGPQAPCTGFVNRFSYDTATAYAQGVDNANQAAAKLLELGLTNPDGTGSVVYYDLEYFYYTSACSAAARAFVQGWTNRLQTLGIYSGLYATSTNLNANKIYNLQPPPSVVWIAEWYTVPGYRPDVTVFDVDHLPDNYWSNHQRVYQYSGGHNETWAGVTINIDNNVLDGVVAVPYDSTAPVTSYTKSGTIGISPWYKTPVTVTLTATDNSVGVKNTYYRINAGSWQTYTTPFAVSGSGQMTIDYRSVDFNNNWEALKTANFYVDTQPPVNPRVTNPGCQAWNGVPQAYCNNPWFTWAGAYDLGVGLNPSDTYEVYWGANKNATSGTRTSANQYNPPAIPTGVPYYLRIRTQDKHGLWSAWQTIYTLIYDYRFTHQVWLPRVAK
jgi:photosystem II stability/assembly factor-like uncharacterized protein